MDNRLETRISLVKKGIESGIFPKKLYKFREFGKWTNKIIEDSEFFFSSPDWFNDPFDCKLSFNEEYTKDEILDKYQYLSDIQKFPIDSYIKKYGDTQEQFTKEFGRITSQMIKSCGILSLSKSNNNITMWSHYANNHTGLAFELDVSEDYDFFDTYGIVEYKKEYELLSYTQDTQDSLATLFLTKFIDWKYEEEVRVIDYKKNGARKFNKNALKTIYFGCDSEREKIDEVIDLCKKNGFEHVEFKQAVKKKGIFGLDFISIE